MNTRKLVFHWDKNLLSDFFSTGKRTKDVEGIEDRGDISENRSTFITSDYFTNDDISMPHPNLQRPLVSSTPRPLVSSTPRPLISSTPMPKPNPPPRKITNHGFQIIMDNLNLVQTTRHKTLDTSNKVHNLVHSIAVQDRISGDNLDDKHPQADILSVPNDAFMPSIEDNKKLRDEFKVLVQRALVNHMEMFSDFKDLGVDHIPHLYSAESAKKSSVIPLGILEKDENITEQMIEVVQHFQQYVPKDGNGQLKPVLLGGDALSVERGEAARRARSDGVTSLERLEGLVWKSEDWHGHVIAIQDTFNDFYKASSSGEMGTLYQLRNRFDRRGVKSQMKSVCAFTVTTIALLVCVLSIEKVEARKSCKANCLSLVFKCKRTQQAKESFDMELVKEICCNDYIACQRNCGIEHPSCGIKGKRGSWNKRFEYDPYSESEIYDQDIY